MEGKRKTQYCQWCWRAGSMRRNTPNLCQCGAVIQKRSKRCADCYHKAVGERNHIRANTLAAQRAAKSWRFRTSKAELQAQELLDVMGVLWRAHVPFGTLTIDLIIDSHGLAVEVYGDYWHNTTAAKERDARRATVVQASGYRLVILHVSKMHLWWLTLQEALKS